MKDEQRRNDMLNAENARQIVEEIERARRDASTVESGILNRLRAMPGYEPNGDKDILEAVRLRAEAREIEREAETLIGGFDWTYDEERGESVRKSHEG